MAATPGSKDPLACCPPSTMRSDPLADLFLDQAGRAPGHEDDDDGEGEHILVGAGERQRDRADGLQSREQKATEDGAIDAAEAADDGGGKADDAEIEAHAEIDFVVIQAVHDAGEGSEPRAD